MKEENQNINFEIEENFKKGLDSYFNEINNESISDIEIAKKLIDFSNENKLLQPDIKGGQIIEIYRSIVNKLKNRILIEDMGIKKNKF